MVSLRTLICLMLFSLSSVPAPAVEPDPIIALSRSLTPGQVSAAATSDSQVRYFRLNAQEWQRFVNGEFGRPALLYRAFDPATQDAAELLPLFSRFLADKAVEKIPRGQMVRRDGFASIPPYLRLWYDFGGRLGGVAQRQGLPSFHTHPVVKVLSKASELITVYGQSRTTQCDNSLFNLYDSFRRRGRHPQQAIDEVHMRVQAEGKNHCWWTTRSQLIGPMRFLDMGTSGAEVDAIMAVYLELRHQGRVREPFDVIEDFVRDETIRDKIATADRIAWIIRHRWSLEGGQRTGENQRGGRGNSGANQTDQRSRNWCAETGRGSFWCALEEQGRQNRN